MSNKPTLSKSSIIDLQKHMLKTNCDWFDGLASNRDTLNMLFKDVPADGRSRLQGGQTPDRELNGEFWMWFRFNDLDGTTHELRFRPFWIAKSYNHIYQQCYMHLNMLIGRDPWADLAPVKKMWENLCIDGRLPQVRED